MSSIVQTFQAVFQKWPYVARVILTMLLIVAAFIIGGLIEKNIPIKPYFPFTGALLLLLVTWFMYRFDGKSLDELGLNLQGRSLSFFMLGLFLGAAAFIIAKGLRMLYTGEGFELHKEFDWQLVLLGLYYILPMVVVEELLYRGYLFKKTIEKSSVFWANVLFSIIFMLVHVIDREVLSNHGMVLFYMVTIPVGHLLFATALLKSKTLMFPIGLHLGNNWASIHVITDMKNDSSLIYITNPASFDTWGYFIGFIVIWNAFFLLLTWLIWKWPVDARAELKFENE